MDKQTQVNDVELKVEGLNQRNAWLTKDQNWQFVHNIIPRQGKRTRIEGKRLITYITRNAIISIYNFGNQVIIQTQNGIYLNDV